MGDAGDFGAIVTFLCGEQAKFLDRRCRSTSTVARTRPALQ